MQKRSLFVPLLLSLCVTGLFSCVKKSNTINNGSVIETPYSLFFSDTAGAIYNTTDGKNIAKTVLPPDGYPGRAMVTSHENLLVVKPNMYVNVNNSTNFNLAYDMLAQYLHTDVNGTVRGLDQTMIISLPGWNHVYVASADPSSSNFFGIAWSQLDGVINTWYAENYYDTVGITNLTNIHTNSFTQTKDGTLFAHDNTNRMFYRPSLDQRWMETANVTPLPIGGYFSIGHLNNELIAIDTKGSNGAYYSDDKGANWHSYTGLPANTPLLSICSPFEQLCLVGTAGKGLYVFNPGTSSFQPSNSGLGDNTTVRGIAFKENIYKNGTHQQYVFLATDQGLFQSSDMGLNWVKTLPGNFVTIY